jgi:chromosome segregation ATPase
MGKHRAVEDRIAETQSQLNALLAKAAKEQVDESPEIQAIDKEIKKITTDTLKFNRWASEGEDKIANFKERVAIWEARLAKATEEVSKAKNKLEGLRKKRKKLAGELASQMAAE